VPDEPIRGFDERIVARARLPVTVLLAIPLMAVVLQYFFYLLENQVSLVTAVTQIQSDLSLFVFLAGVPVIALAFFRELLVHQLLDKLVGTRSAVDQEITKLMSELASFAGYSHLDQIKKNPIKARQWFYSYANEQTVLRNYAFEVWEGYYVGLYLSLASAISFLTCLVLLNFISFAVVTPFATFSLAVFVASWAVRRWSTIPTIMRIPEQQIAEVSRTGIWQQAQHRFD
jgi:hypothetical protein